MTREDGFKPPTRDPTSDSLVFIVLLTGDIKDCQQHNKKDWKAECRTLRQRLFETNHHEFFGYFPQADFFFHAVFPIIIFIHLHR